MDVGELLPYRTMSDMSPVEAGNRIRATGSIISRASAGAVALVAVGTVAALVIVGGNGGVSRKTVKLRARRGRPERMLFANVVISAVVGLGRRLSVPRITLWASWIQPSPAVSVQARWGQERSPPTV